MGWNHCSPGEQGGQLSPAVNGLYELSCPFIGRNARPPFSFHPSLFFLVYFFSCFIYIYIFFSFFPLFSIERQEKKREGQKEKNREGQEREAVKRSVYTRLRIYFIAASLVRPSRRARPLARSELGLIKT